MIIIKQNGDILELTVQEYKELYGETNSYNNFYCPGYYPDDFKDLDVISLFSGIGAFEKALEKL